MGRQKYERKDPSRVQGGKAAAKKNPWLRYVAKMKRENPKYRNMPFGEANKALKGPYAAWKRKQGCGGGVKRRRGAKHFEDFDCCF